MTGNDAIANGYTWKTTGGARNSRFNWNRRITRENAR
jgi:hypothetical protein